MAGGGSSRRRIDVCFFWVSMAFWGVEKRLLGQRREKREERRERDCKGNLTGPEAGWGCVCGVVLCHGGTKERSIKWNKTL